LPAVKLVLSMPRAEIYERVDRRVDAMIAAGWLDEVRSLIARGYDETMPSLSSHGYREMMAVARGTMTLTEAAQKTKWMVHAYIRRQTSWLKQQPEYHWLTAGPAAADEAARIVAERLQRPDGGSSRSGESTTIER
jgi:tRNA dimethylallyltransferase